MEIMSRGVLRRTRRRISRAPSMQGSAGSGSEHSAAAARAASRRPAAAVRCRQQLARSFRVTSSSSCRRLPLLSRGRRLAPPLVLLGLLPRPPTGRLPRNPRISTSVSAEG